LATVSSDNIVRIWDVRLEEQITALRHETTVRTVVFRPGRRRLATVDDNHTVHLWNVQTGKRLSSFHYDLPLNVAVFSPDLTWLATAIDDHPQVWDLDSGEEIAVLHHETPVNAALFSPDERRLATVSHDSTVRTSIIKVWDMPSGRELAVFQSCDAVNGIVFNSDGSLLVTIGKNHVVQVWETEHIQSTWDFLDERRLITGRHHVVGPTYTDVEIRAEVVHVARVSPKNLLADIAANLRNFFDPLHGAPGPEKQGWPFGREVYTSEVYQVIENTEGVDHADSLILYARRDYALEVTKETEGVDHVDSLTLRTRATNGTWQERDRVDIARNSLVHFVFQPDHIQLRLAR
jgi:hypothetical protein